MPRDITQHELQDELQMVSYDWRDRPDWDRIEVLQAEGYLYATEVPDTHGDSFVVFFSTTKIDRSLAQEVWDNWDWMYEEEQGRA